MTGAEITVTFLGTGAAIPPNDRQQVSTVLRHQEGLFMFDCGEGTQYALRKFGISTRKEFVIWISHLHSDHFLGLPGLLSSFALLGRKEPITIIGPVGIKKTVQNIIEANFVNFEYKLGVIEVKPGSEIKSKNYTIQAYKAKHDGEALSVLWSENNFPGKVNMDKILEMGIEPGPQIGKLQQGESVTIGENTIRPEDVIGEPRKGRKIAYSGDTAYNPDLADHFSEIDVLIHEGTYPSDMVELAKERQHSTIRQAAEIADLIKPDKLIITHLSPRIHDIKAEEEAAKRIYPNTEIAYQGYTLKIPYPYHDDQ